MTDRPLQDEAPTDASVTEYDRLHAPRYLRLLDALSAGAPWTQAVRVVLGIDPEAEPERARRAYDSHLARARWMVDEGYRELLRMPPKR